MSFQTKNRCQLKESLQAKRIAANKCGRSLEIKTADRRKLKQSIPANHVKNTTGELPLAALMDTTEGIWARKTVVWREVGGAVTDCQQNCTTRNEGFFSYVMLQGHAQRSFVCTNNFLGKLSACEQIFNAFWNKGRFFLQSECRILFSLKPSLSTRKEF